MRWSELEGAAWERFKVLVRCLVCLAYNQPPRKVGIFVCFRGSSSSKYSTLDVLPDGLVRLRDRGGLKVVSEPRPLQIHKILQVNRLPSDLLP
jgi:hypothetical protein